MEILKRILTFIMGMIFYPFISGYIMLENIGFFNKIKQYNMKIINTKIIMEITILYLIVTWIIGFGILRGIKKISQVPLVTLVTLHDVDSHPRLFFWEPSISLKSQARRGRGPADPPSAFFVGRDHAAPPRRSRGALAAPPLEPTMTEREDFPE